LRYQQIDTVSFTDIYGNSFNIKDMREYIEYQTATTTTVQNDSRIDEIASRPEIYGDDSEGDSYRIIDHNLVVIMENNFELSGLGQIKIPVR
jgi:hypothetical protein